MASFTGTQSKCKACAKTVYPMEQLTANGIIFHRACFRCAHCKATISLNSFAAIEGVPYCKPHFEQLFKQTGSYTRSFEGAIKAEKDSTPPPESLTPSAVVKATEKRSTPSPLALKFGGTQDKCKVCSKTVYPLEKPILTTRSALPCSPRVPACACSMQQITVEAADLTTTRQLLYKSFQLHWYKLANYTSRAPSPNLFPVPPVLPIPAHASAPTQQISVEGVTYHKQCFRCVHSNCSLTTSNYAALNGSLYCKHHYNQLFLVKGTYSNINKSAAVAAALGVPAEESAAAPADGSGGGGDADGGSGSAAVPCLRAATLHRVEHMRS
ncbi:unnamed protein product [Closterium sp. Naga37s-1]|nr:unnamed protein product [Closterium sp. Naga37s-1]